jgi:YrbI family 3-deoxy-D-manno-octulosonate 8-phosphate phosphatase
MIKLVLIDIDGVLTDGKITVDSIGNEYKTINIRDIDAVFEMKRQKLQVGLITGEATPITLIYKERFKPDFFYAGCKNKPEALREILSQTGLSAEQACYVGDGKYDIPMMKLVKISACPSDAISEVKALAGIHLSTRGGDGCVWELLEWINKNRETNGNG